MIADAEIADFVLAMYDYPDTPMVDWDHYVETLTGPCWAMKRLDGFDLVILRGTTTISDTVIDLMAWANPCNTEGLGPLHPGFWLGMQAVEKTVRTICKQPVIVAGHSLGGAHAAILAGLMVLSEKMGGHAPAQLVTYGAPRAGFKTLIDVLHDVPLQKHIENHQDMIPDLPFRLPELEAYHNYESRIAVNVAPKPADHIWWPWPWSRHHMRLYREALNVAS